MDVVREDKQIVGMKEKESEERERWRIKTGCGPTQKLRKAKRGRRESQS